MEILILSVLLIFTLFWAFSSMGLVSFKEKTIELPTMGFRIIGGWNDELDKRLRMFVANQHKVCHMTHWKYISSIKKNGLLVKTPPGAGGMDAGLGISSEEARLKYGRGVHIRVGTWFPSDYEIGHLPIGITNDYARELAESSRINQHIILERDIPPEDLLIPLSKELYGEGLYKTLKDRFKNLIKNKEILAQPQPRGKRKEYDDAKAYNKLYTRSGYSSLRGPMAERIREYDSFFDYMDWMFGWYNRRSEWFKTTPYYNDFIKLKDNPDFIKMMEYSKLIRSGNDMELSQFLRIFLGDLIILRTIPKIRKKSKGNITETEELSDAVNWS
jgi:hypothetical protein